MTPVRHVIYVHGFASSPASSKAQRFARELATRSIGFSCPDLNQPAFETLTVTRMLAQIRDVVAAIPSGPIALVGSSLGAFVAVHAAHAGDAHAEDAEKAERIERQGLGARSVDDQVARAFPGPRDGSAPATIDRLILLAPALDFGGNRMRQLGEHGIDEWRRSGHLRVFHYAANEYRDVDFALYQDAATYDAFTVSCTLPALVFQGRRDDTVDPATVERWARARSSVDLRLVDDGHQLTESLDLIWGESEKFLGLAV